MINLMLFCAEAIYMLQTCDGILQNRKRFECQKQKNIKNVDAPPYLHFTDSDSQLEMWNHSWEYFSAVLE